MLRELDDGSRQVDALLGLHRPRLGLALARVPACKQSPVHPAQHACAPGAAHTEARGVRESDGSATKEAAMAVGVLIPMPGVTQQQYEQVNDILQEKIDPNQGVDGLIIHSAGPMDGGWYIYDIWESKEQFGRFAQANVAPAVQQVMGAEMNSEPQFFEIANLILAGQPVA